MQNNSQGRRDRSEPNPSASKEDNTHSESRGLRKDMNPVDDAIPAELKATITSSIRGFCMKKYIALKE